MKNGRIIEEVHNTLLNIIESYYGEIPESLVPLLRKQIEYLHSYVYKTGIEDFYYFAKRIDESSRCGKCEDSCGSHD